MRPVGGAVALCGCSDSGSPQPVGEKFIHSERAKTEGAVWHLIMPPAHAG